MQHTAHRTLGYFVSEGIYQKQDHQCKHPCICFEQLGCSAVRICRLKTEVCLKIQQAHFGTAFDNVLNVRWGEKVFFKTAILFLQQAENPTFLKTRDGFSQMTCKSSMLRVRSRERVVYVHINDNIVVVDI